MATPTAWGTVRLCDPATPPGPEALRSYDHKGLRLEWSPDKTEGVRYACDHERYDAPTRMTDLSRLAPDRFFPAWVRAEVEAKLHDVPIWQWIRDGLTSACRDCEVILLPSDERIVGLGRRHA